MLIVMLLNDILIRKTREKVYNLEEVFWIRVIGASALTSIIYLLTLHVKANEPSQELLTVLFVGWLILFILWCIGPDSG